jgi:protein-L-isoaspartate(D-aspartate) O-methyltransferase
MTAASGHAPGDAPAGGTSANGADAARARLAGALRDSGRTPSPAVQAAFRAVPRHLFLPGLSPAAAYQDEALVIKYDEDGLPVSSSSQPAMMAIMLEQLGLEPGHRVLEIGTGTGYNAAVMAHVVGPRGRVVTVDIDAELVTRAQASLVTAGYDTVQASCGDGGYGDPQGAQFDRVIVTAGAWDIAPAWLNQLAPGGRLVLPLAVRSIQLSVGLERSGHEPGGHEPGGHEPGGHEPSDHEPGGDQPGGDQHWVSTSAFRCGFVRMLGAFAGPESFRPLGPSPGLYVQVDDGRRVDTEALAAALAGPAVDVGTGIRAGSRDELGDLDLWLTLTEPGLDRLTFMETAASPVRSSPPLPFGGLASRGRDDQFGVSGLAGARGADAADPPASDPAACPGEVVMRGCGPGGAALAARLARQAAVWAGRGRPGTADLRVTVWPAGTDLTEEADGQIIATRPHVRLAAGWPAR